MIRLATNTTHPSTQRLRRTRIRNHPPLVRRGFAAIRMGTCRVKEIASLTGNLPGEECRVSQDRAPLIAALAAQLAAAPARLHLPGHKGGRWVDPEFGELFQTRPWELDLTELPGLDDLHSPSGPIAEAQELAAQAFGAEETLFLVNGSTSGLLALILATVGPGDLLVLARNCHRAAAAGLVLSGATPAFVPAEVDPDLGLPVAVEAARLEQTLSTHPHARAVLVVSPTYQGFASDLPALASVCHRRDIPLLVDEAHGPHFHFHPALPPTALAAGADAAVQSLHKTGGSLTGSALLHLQGPRLDRDRVRLMARLIQTSSPSYPLLASLDAARRRLATRGQADLERAISLARPTRQAIQDLGFPCPGEDYAGRGVVGYDPTRLLVNVAGRGGDGYAAEAHLRRAGVQVEYADPSNFLALLSPADDPVWLTGLVQALALLPSGQSGGFSAVSALLWGTLPSSATMPARAVRLPHSRVPLAESTGRTCAELICPYPPGIPVLVPGEVVPATFPEALAALAALGCRFPGSDLLGRGLAVL
jgi:lysine decarboxylase